MNQYERVGNIHIHTLYSDGSARPEEIAAVANRAGLDFIIITDHMTYRAEERWHGSTLLLFGEEVHAPAFPHANHYLALNVGEDLQSYGGDTRQLVQAVRARNGLGFIAHPYEYSGAFANEPEINWTAWDAKGYMGIEIWNYMSEFKSYVTSLPKALLYALFPKLAITGPYHETLAKWDELLGTSRIVAIGGSDAHARTYRVGPLSRQVFSYAHLFRSVNTHVLLPAAWSGDATTDARMLYKALGNGRAFVAYDGLVPARNFRFTADYQGSVYTMGDEVITHSGGTVQFQVQAPARARLRLLQNGFCIAEARGQELVYNNPTPGNYRVEAYRPYAFKERGWIYSNPIYVHP